MHLHLQVERWPKKGKNAHRPCFEQVSFKARQAKSRSLCGLQTLNSTAHVTTFVPNVFNGNTASKPEKMQRKNVSFFVFLCARSLAFDRFLVYDHSVCVCVQQYSAQHSSFRIGCLYIIYVTQVTMNHIGMEQTTTKNRKRERIMKHNKNSNNNCDSSTNISHTLKSNYGSSERARAHRVQCERNGIIIRRNTTHIEIKKNVFSSVLWCCCCSPVSSYMANDLAQPCRHTAY